MARLSKMLCPIFQNPNVFHWARQIFAYLDFMFMYSHEVTVELLIREKW